MNLKPTEDNYLHFSLTFTQNPENTTILGMFKKDQPVDIIATITGDDDKILRNIVQKHLNTSK